MSQTAALPKKGSHIHLVGIGGIGVSALVPELLKRGYRVSGSDREENAVAARLKKMGARVESRHRAENIEGAALVVKSAAVKSSNAEIKEAKLRGIPILHRAEMLGLLLAGKRSMVVAGAHGKTSITGMAAWLLRESGLDPSAYIGGDIVGFGGGMEAGNAITGHGDWAVAEGDESDGSFTFLRPDAAVVNNIDADHLDHFKNLDSIVEAFQSFIDGIQPNGWLFRSADCPNAMRLCARDDARELTYGFAEDADVRGVDYRRNGHGWVCEVAVRGQARGRIKLKRNGRMNYHNALAVIALAEALDIPFENVQRALASFPGVKRRMEEKGDVGGVAVIDDYAHHPAEIQATLNALRERGPRRLIAVFQPHLVSRTRLLMEEFSQSFHEVDLLVVTDIYAAREKADPGFSGETLVNRLRIQQIPVVYIPRVDEVARFLSDVARPGDCCVTLGAGDVHKVGDEMISAGCKAETE